MSELKELSSITSKIGSGLTPRGGNSVYTDNGISLIRSQNVLDMDFSTENLAYIDEVQAEKLKNVIVENSKEIIDKLTKIIGCDRNWFTIEHQNTEYIFDGKIVDGYTFVELYWFARDEKIKKEVADFLTKFIKKINNNKDCCIIFFTLTGDNYCDNGEFF